ncbi:MAG TPA: glutaminase, partial [Spirochaetia bacterium]|nr:glutaminase [Spirochaetia bacterium]
MEPDYDRILADIAQEVRPLLALGAPADYIPALARVPRDRFGMAVRTLEGRIHAVGDADEPFSIQSVSKVFTFILALRSAGDGLWDRIQREPSGDPFNSPILLEQERGIPRNPFINAGALVVADILLEALEDPREELLRFVRARSGSGAVRADPEVAESERSTGHRNAALAHLLKSFGNLENRVEE